MPYATPEQLEQLGSAGATLGEMVEATVTAALEAASDLADSYLRQRYALPLTAWGSELTRAVCSLATYDLLSNRGYDPQSGDNASIRQRYEDAIAWLEKVAAGKLSPSLTDSTAAAAEDDGPIIISNPRRGW